MKLGCLADTDPLYIDRSDEPSVESREISEGVVLDHNAAARLSGRAGSAKKFMSRRATNCCCGRSLFRRIVRGVAECDL